MLYPRIRPRVSRSGKSYLVKPQGPASASGCGAAAAESLNRNKPCAPAPQAECAFNGAWCVGIPVDPRPWGVGCPFANPIAVFPAFLSSTPGAVLLLLRH